MNRIYFVRYEKHYFSYSLVDLIFANITDVEHRKNPQIGGSIEVDMIFVFFIFPAGTRRK